MKYACIAGLKRVVNGVVKLYRCRNWAQDPPQNLFCVGHSNHPVLAPLPERVFVKMTVPRTSDNLHDIEEFQFHVADRDKKKERDLEVKHAQHAEQFSRGAYSVRKTTSDSGVQVFGPDGLHDMSLVLMDGNLIQAGLNRVGGHVLDKIHEGKLIFVIEYSSIPNPDGTKLPNRADGYLKRLLGSCWGTIHIWANPPRVEDGVIVHTVNAGRLNREQIPVGHVVLASGHWSFKTTYTSSGSEA